jgi:hypothetical protein
MEIKNWRRFSFFLSISIFCFAYLYVSPSANAQYQQYYDYGYQTTTLGSSYLYNNMYSKNYLWPTNFGNNPALQNFADDGWILRPNFGLTVYTATSKGNALSIQGTYFSAHTQAGVNFDRTVSFDNSLSSMYSMPYMQFNQTMLGNLGGQSSLNSYARQVLQFSPVLHGPLLYNY